MRDAWRRLADERDTLLAENGVSLFFPRNESPLLLFAQDGNRKTRDGDNDDVSRERNLSTSDHGVVRRARCCELVAITGKLIPCEPGRQRRSRA